MSSQSSLRLASFLFNLFSLFCSTSLFSTLLIHSSASCILLLVASDECFISVTVFCISASLIFFFFCLFAFSRATPVAYGGSQARGLIQAVAAKPAPEPQQCRIRAAHATYTTAHSNARSLTHWAMPGIEPATSWFLVRFVNHWAMMETHAHLNFKYYISLLNISVNDQFLPPVYFQCLASSSASSV